MERSNVIVLSDLPLARLSADFKWLTLSGGAATAAFEEDPSRGFERVRGAEGPGPEALWRSCGPGAEGPLSPGGGEEH